MCGAAAFVSTNAVVHVEVERPLEEPGARVHERAGHGAAGVVDDDVDAAELGHRPGDDVFDGFVVVDVARDHERAPAEAADLLGDRVELLLGARREHDVGAGFGVGPRGLRRRCRGRRR